MCDDGGLDVLTGKCNVKTKNRLRVTPKKHDKRSLSRRMVEYNNSASDNETEAITSCAECHGEEPVTSVGESSMSQKGLDSDTEDAMLNDQIDRLLNSVGDDPNRENNTGEEDKEISIKNVHRLHEMDTDEEDELLDRSIDKLLNAAGPTNRKATNSYSEKLCCDQDDTYDRRIYGHEGAKEKDEEGDKDGGELIFNKGNGYYL